MVVQKFSSMRQDKFKIKPEDLLRMSGEVIPITRMGQESDDHKNMESPFKNFSPLKN